MDAAGKLVGLRLFLEGIEVDVSSATVTCGVGIPAIAQIGIPATDEAHELLPRTLVHLFYLEGAYERFPEETSTTYELLNPKDPYAWKLLFVGEVIAYSFRKVGGLRDITLSCMDMSSYWQAAKLYWGKRGTSVQSYKQAIYMGATEVTRGGKKVDTSDGLMDILLKKSSTIPTLPGLLGGIVALLESAVGVYEEGNTEKFRGANDFLSQAELRLHLTRMIGVSAKDTSSDEFFKSSAFKRYMQRLTQSQSSTASFMDTITAVLDRIYHTWVSVAAPPFFREGSKVLGTVQVPVEGSAAAASLINKDTAVDVAMAKATSSWLAATLSEVRNKKNLGPNETDPIKFISTGADTPESGVDIALHTRFAAMLKSSGIMSPSTSASYFEIRGADLFKKMSEKSIGTVETRQNIVRAYNTLFKARVKAVLCVESIVSNAAANANDHQLWVEIFNDCVEAISMLEKGVSGTSKSVSKEFSLRDRLYAFMIHPDLYMVPPPTCNVLFPDQFMQLGYSRSFLSEVSRLMMFGRTESGANTKDVYFAPNASMLAGPSKEDAIKAATSSSSYIMEHEKYGGIIPTILGMGDADIFKKLLSKTVKDATLEAKKGDKKDENDVVGEARYSKQEHMQKAATASFFAARYGSRPMTVTARFSPKMIPGLPILLLDPNREASGTISSLSPTGTHFVGELQQLTHVFDASGGVQSALQVSYVRAVTEDTGMYASEDGSPTATKSEATETREEIKSKEGYWKIPAPQAEGDVTINEYKIPTLSRIEIQERTGRSFKETDTFDIAPLYDENKKPRGEYSSQHPFIGYFKIYRMGSSSKSKTYKFNFEATLYPPWLAGIYYPSRIGNEYYRELLGCASVVDGGVEIPKQDTDTLTQESSDLADAMLETANAPTGSDVGPAAPTQSNTVLQTSDLTSVTVPSDLLTASSSVLSAANKLATLWLAMKKIDGNVDKFIDMYTDRKVATLPDILGFDGVRFLQEHTAYLDLFASDFAERGTVPFHGQAFGLKENLEGLGKLEPLSQSLDKNVSSKTIDGRIDPRKERYLRVHNYAVAVARMRDRGA